MKSTFDGVWFRAARYAAAVALLCGSQISWGEDKAPAAPAAEPAAATGQIEFGDGQADDLFDKYVSLAHLGSAWRNLDASAMTDSALQFAEAERVLLRSHGSIKASQVFDMAIRVATEKGDKASLGRLAKSLERSGDKDRLAQVNLALKTAGASRAVDPVLTKGDTNALLSIQSVQVEIQSARIGGSNDQLKAIGQSLSDLPITAQQQAALKAEISAAAEAVSVNQGNQSAVLELDRLGDVPRSFTELKGPIGGKFSMPVLESKPPVESDFASLAEEYKKLGLTLKESSDPLAALSLPTRNQVRGQTPVKWGGGIRGMATIWQWVNTDGYKTGSNCGTAAAATLLTRYDRGSRFQPYATPYNAVQKLEREGCGPDVLGGAWGTSRNRMQDIANKYGFNYAWGTKAQLEGCVAAGYPVAVMLDIANDKAGYPKVWDQWGFHWVVVYAVDANNFYVTNWPTASGAIPKDWFYKGWEENGVAKSMLINSRFFYIAPK